jgi:hypothetical protein
MVHVTAALVRADMHPEEPHFTVFYDGMTVLEICISCPEGLYLGALEYETCFDCVEDEIVVSCFAI